MKIQQLREVLAASSLSEKQQAAILSSDEVKIIQKYDTDQLELALSEVTTPKAIVKYLSQWDKAKANRKPSTEVNVGRSVTSNPTRRSGDDPDDDRFREDNPFRYKPG